MNDYWKFDLEADGDCSVLMELLRELMANPQAYEVIMNGETDPTPYAIIRKGFNPNENLSD